MRTGAQQARGVAAVAVLGTLWACVAQPGPPGVGDTSAVGRIRVASAPTGTTSSFRLQAPRAAWDEQALASGAIQVWLRTADEPAPGRAIALLPGHQRRLTLANLRRDQTYVVLLRGWLDGEVNGAPASTPISVDADSVATFDTLPVAGHYATVREVAFQLQLADQTFAGEGRSSAAIRGGEVVDTPLAEALAP